MVIAGAGIVGSVLALALAQSGQRVCLIEARPGAHGQGRRPIALSLASERILRGLGVWSAIAPHAAAIRMVHVSEKGHFGVTRIRARECGVAALGQVCEARFIEAALAAALEKFTGAQGRVRQLSPAIVRHAHTEEHQVRVSLAAVDSAQSIRIPEQLTTRLLVAADGATSGLRDSYQLPVMEREYRQLALVCRVRPESPHAGRAFERFTRQGPLALLPLVDGRCALVWSVSRETGEAMLKLDEGAFVKILQEQFGRRLGRFSALSSRSGFPLKLVQSRTLTGPRFAIVGNAAQQLHPVAGQGLNLGLRGVALLAELIAERLQAGEDPGDRQMLMDYARRRHNDRRWVTGFTDLLARAATPRFRKLSALRSLGLLSLDLLPFVKGALARRTMGLAGYQPRLVRGLSLDSLMPAERLSGS